MVFDDSTVYFQSTVVIWRLGNPFSREMRSHVPRSLSRALIGKLILRTSPRRSANITGGTLFADSRSIGALVSNARVYVRRHVAEPLKRKRTDTQILSFHVCATSRSSDSSPSFNTAMITRANNSTWKYVGSNEPLQTIDSLANQTIQLQERSFTASCHLHITILRIFISEAYTIRMYVHKSFERTRRGSCKTSLQLSQSIEMIFVFLIYVPSPSPSIAPLPRNSQLAFFFTHGRDSTDDDLPSKQGEECIGTAVGRLS